MNLVDKYGLDDPPSKFKLKKSELMTATLAINLLSLALPVMVLQVYDRILVNRINEGCLYRGSFNFSANFSYKIL